MTLVHDDEIKKVFLEQSCQPTDCVVVTICVVILPVRQLLIKGEVNLMRCDRHRIILGKVDFMNGFLQRREILLDRLVDQNVSVGKIQNLTDEARFQKTIYDLERSICFACSRCHDKKQSFLPPGDGVHCSIHGVALIISRRICCGAGVIWLLYDFFFVFRQSLPAVCACAETCHQFIGSGELRQRDLAFFTC